MVTWEPFPDEQNNRQTTENITFPQFRPRAVDLTNLEKYQGVKEFHMLARISCYCKIMGFSPFELGRHLLSIIQE